MSLKRKAIRNGLKTYLDGKTAAGSRIFSNRGSHIWESEMPLMLIYTRDESAEIFEVAPRVYKKDAKISLEAVVQVNESTDDALDDIGDQLEKAIFANETLDLGNGILANDAVLESTEMEIADNGEKTVGVIRQTWSFTYFENAPADNEAPEDNFETLGVKYDFPPPDDVPEAEDEINLEQE